MTAFLYFEILGEGSRSCTFRIRGMYVCICNILQRYLPCAPSWCIGTCDVLPHSKQKAPRMSLLGFDVVQLEEKLKANHTFL